MYAGLTDAVRHNVASSSLCDICWTSIAWLHFDIHRFCLNCTMKQVGKRLALAFCMVLLGLLGSITLLEPETVEALLSQISPAAVPSLWWSGLPLVNSITNCFHVLARFACGYLGLLARRINQTSHIVELVQLTSTTLVIARCMVCQILIPKF